MFDFDEERNEWPEDEIIDTICLACDLPAVTNDLGLCSRCYAKLERDLIRARDWDYSGVAFGTPDDKLETLRQRVIEQYGAAYELIASPETKRKKKKRPKKPVQPPKLNLHAKQPEPPPEPLQEYTEEDVLAAIEQIIRATTKAYGWRPLGDVGQFLRRSFADFDPSKFGCKKLLDLIEKHPERFKVKWSAPAKKGASQVWVRMVDRSEEK